MKSKVFQGSLVGSVLLIAFLAWFSVDRAIRVPEASAWLVPILWFSLLMIFLSLTTILLKKSQLLFLVLAVVCLESLLFAFYFQHFLILILSFLLIAWGAHLVRKDLNLNIKVSLWKSLLTGKTQFIFALALLISSQYFFTISHLNGQKIMPKLDVSPAMVKALVPFLGALNPSFAGMDQEGLTVDQYILKIQEENTAASDLEGASSEMLEAQIPADIPVKQRELLKQEALKKMSEAQSQLSQKNKELILREGRRQFSEIVGQQLRGDEKITEVLAEPIGRKINEYLQPPIKGDSNSTLFPLILSFVLFLTIAPLGSVLSRIWFVLIILGFKFFVKVGLVEIKAVPTEREIII